MNKYQGHIYNTCTVDFDWDSSIPGDAKNLYRALKGHTRKSADNDSNQFVRPSKKRLMKLCRFGSNTLEHSLKVLQLVGLVIVHSGKRKGQKIEVNDYEITDDAFLYKPNENTQLGEGKNLFDIGKVIEMFKEYTPEKILLGKSAKPPKELSHEAMDIAQRACEQLRKEPPPGVKIEVDAWASIIDKIQRTTKISYDEIDGVLFYALKNDFWSKYIFRPNKFKQKFPELYKQKFNKKANYGIEKVQQRTPLGQQ